MNQFFAQIRQWPPTSSTVIGLGVIVGLVSYMATGSFEMALALAGAFKILCPEDAAMVDRVMKLDETMIPHGGKVR